MDKRILDNSKLIRFENSVCSIAGCTCELIYDCWKQQFERYQKYKINSYYCISDSISNNKRKSIFTDCQKVYKILDLYSYQNKNKVSYMNSYYDSYINESYILLLDLNLCITFYVIIDENNDKYKII